MTKIFLEENRSVRSNNVGHDLNIDFDVKKRLLPDENLVDDFSLYQQYLRERDECCKYRIILNVNALCTNVLFNSITEIVIDEGSDTCKCLNFFNGGLNKATFAKNAVNAKNPIKYIDAIRNTEYSHPKNGKFIYHCGVDIFNNHMLRKKNFVHINKINNDNVETLTNCSHVYNTLQDYLRDAKGNIIKDTINIYQSQNWNGEQYNYMHVYNTDSLQSLRKSFYEKCYDKDGWWGFTNPGMININTTSSSSISTNEMLSNNKPCEFIDMYPDRSLFSFVPKYNKIRRRVENNWDYCITYPSSKDYDLIDTICGGKNGAVKAMVKIVTASSGVKLLQCTSFFKHTFTVSSYVNFYYYMLWGGEKPETVDTKNFIRPLKTEYYSQKQEEQEQEESKREEEIEYTEDDLSFQKYQKEIRIFSVGDLNGNNRERVFSVRYDDIKDLYDNFAAFGCFYKKSINNTECSYYARKFKKIKNDEGENLMSDVNKTAFSKNIYGDDIAQIIFTDGVDLCGIKDENGRDVSDIYFTVIKRNAGNELWYKEKNTSNSKIEESHCFGTLTSGIDFSGVDVNEEPFDYNVHYLHNLDETVCYDEETNVENKPARNTFSAWGDTILAGMPKFIESGITINNDEFYGDIVEFDNYNYETHVIGNICHRFNTAQRECFDLAFRDMKYDVISYDDYDQVNLGRSFTVDTYYCNDVFTSLHKVTDTATTDNLMYANIMPEGYFYNPHNRIQIKEVGSVLHSDAYYINYGECDFKFDANGIMLKALVPDDYGFIKGDYVAMYDKTNGEIVWGVIYGINDLWLSVYMGYEDFYGLDIANHTDYFLPDNGARRYFMFWTKNSVPTYAKLSVETKTFSWRNTLKMSEIRTDSKFYDMPFSNGYNYVQKNINFFVKRQDPHGEYGLSYPKFKDNAPYVFNVMSKYIMEGADKTDLSKHGYVDNKDLNICY